MNYICLSTKYCFKSLIRRVYGKNSTPGSKYCFLLLTRWGLNYISKTEIFQWFLNTKKCFVSNITGICSHNQGWGLLSQFSPFRFFPCFSEWSKQWLPVWYQVHIWQVSPQLSSCFPFILFSSCERENENEYNGSYFYFSYFVCGLEKRKRMLSYSFSIFYYEIEKTN